MILNRKCFYDNVLFFYVGWAGADVVEDLVSRSNRAAGLVWRDVDGVIVG